MLQKSQKQKTGVSTFQRVGISVLLCFTALAIGGVSFVVLASMKQGPKPRDKVPRVYNVEVFYVQEQPELQEIITGFGTAKADREVVLTAEVSGRVVETPVNLKVGQKVYPTGESTSSTSRLLVRIEPDVYIARIAQIQALIDQDDEEIAGLRQDYLNNQKLLENAKENYFVFKEDYDRLVAARDRKAANDSEVNKARLELQRYRDIITQTENSLARHPTRLSAIKKHQNSKKAELTIAWLDFEHCKIAAPFEGYISEAMVEVGQSVRIGDPIVKITDSSVVEIPIGISIDQYVSIRADIEKSLGSPRSQPILVEIANDETSESIRLGYLVRVSPIAEESTRTVQLFVRVSNNLANLYQREKKIKILPGQFVHVRIEGPVHRNLQVIPRDAIVNNKIFIATNIKPVEDEGETDTFEAIVEERKITVDKKFNALASVKSGINSKDMIILTNLETISSGAIIRFKGKKVRKLDDELSSQFSRLVRPKQRVSVDRSQRVSN